MTYLDTGCFVKLYYPEPDSAKVIALIHCKPVCYTPLHELEFVNALQLKVFTKSATAAQVTAACSLVEADLKAGVLVTAAFELVNPLTDLELRSRYGLSAREVEVARLVATGLSNQEVAEQLGVSYFTARNHVERVLSKLGVGNRSRVGAVLRNEAA